MNALLLEHETREWQLMYNPALSLDWVEAFISGEQQTLDFEDFRLHDQPGNALIESERGAAVVHQLSLRLWPWQTAQYVFKKYLIAQRILEQRNITYATPLTFGLKKQETVLNYDFIFLRSFVAGRPLDDYYLQHRSLTPELTSLAADVCLFLKKLARLGFRIEMLRACDIVYKNKQLVLANWWRALPVQKAKSTRKSLPLARFMLAWQKRVDYHNLFLESFRRINVDISLEID